MESGFNYSKIIFKLGVLIRMTRKTSSGLARLVGNNIRKYRKSNNITIEALAEKADLGAAYLGEIERGNTNITIFTIEKIARALDVFVSDLFLKDVNQFKFNKNTFLKKCERLSNNPQSVNQCIKSILEIERLFQ